MLLLSRKRGEKIVIGNGITVTVLEVRGDQVRLGFNAPAEVPIRRKEIHCHGRVSVPEGEDTRELTVTDAPSITETVMQRLQDSPYKVMRRVSCECKRGVLFLRGRLFSFHEKQVAQAVVAGVRGVTRGQRNQSGLILSGLEGGVAEQKITRF